MLVDKDAITTLQNILASVRTTRQDVQQQWRKQIALSLAKDTAIPYGKVLQKEEMEDLMNKLLALKNYRFTEDGKTVVSILSDDELAKKF